MMISVGFIFLFNTLDAPLNKQVPQPQNTAPVVKIVFPGNNSAISAGTQLHYSITVSDKEDGSSKYDEINIKEVLLEVKFITDTSGLPEALKKSNEKDPRGLAAIRISNCFNCHDFNSKLIGPAFMEIRKRYQPTPANFTLLQKRIREGSTGIWGKVSMPTHPELSSEQIRVMIKWIMENAVVDNGHYYSGTEGTFNVPETGKPQALLLTASYTDHGINNTGSRLEGKDVVVVRVK